MAQDLVANITTGIGYQFLQLNDSDLKTIREMVTHHWLSVIEGAAPQLVFQFKNTGIERYHELSTHLKHDTLWSKLNRILPKQDIQKIRKLNFINELESHFSFFEISDEENIGYEEIYWRLVRPGAIDDVGPMHADRWFWDLGHGTTPEGVVRVKIWIPLFVEPGLNGLKVVPDSHKKEWKYTGEKRHGFVKPVFEEDESKLDVHLLNTQPGQAVVFNDNLLHGGAVNSGLKTRVSCEFTMFVKKEIFS